MGRRSPLPGRVRRGGLAVVAAVMVAGASVGAPVPAAAQQRAEAPTLQGIEAAADSGRTEEARRELSRWLALAHPDLPAAVRARADYLRGRLATNLDTAVLAYTTVAIGGVSPWAAAARLRLAQLRLARREYGRALSDLATLRADFPGDSLAAESWVWTGVVLAASGDSAGACTAWRTAAGRAKGHVVRTARSHLSAAHCPGASSPAAGAGTAAGAEGGRWTVQIGAFSTRDAAERLRERASAAGFQVRVVDTSGRDGLFRVWTQEVPDASSADALRGRLEEAGFPAIPVQPGDASGGP
jgi:hypothetical protein